MLEIETPYFGSDATGAIDEMLSRHYPAGVFILIDENTKQFLKLHLEF